MASALTEEPVFAFLFFEAVMDMEFKKNKYSKVTKTEKKSFYNLCFLPG